MIRRTKQKRGDEGYMKDRGARSTSSVQRTGRIVRTTKNTTKLKN